MKHALIYLPIEYVVISAHLKYIGNRSSKSRTSILIKIFFRRIIMISEFVITQFPEKV